MHDVKSNLKEKGGLDNGAGDTVWVNIGSRAAVLQVAVALSRDVPRDTNGRATVGNAGGE